MANTLARTHQLDQLNGAQKAAILCMVLGSEASSLITNKLGQEEVEQISFEIARMDRVSNEATEAVLSEWLEVMFAADSIAAGGMEFAREVLEKAFGSAKSTAILKRIQMQISETAGLHRLRNAESGQRRWRPMHGGSAPPSRRVTSTRMRRSTVDADAALRRAG